MCYRVNSDNSGRVTGVSYYGPDGSDNTIEAEIVILTPFIYDNTRLLLLSKTEKFPNGLANSSGQVGKHLMAHIGARVFAAFDDRYVNIYMGPSAQKHSLDDFNADNFDHGGMGFIRGAQISVSPADLEAGPIGTAMSMNPPPGTPRWGAAYRDFLAKYFARYAAHRRADREPALRRSDDRPRSGRARSVGLAGAAPDLRLAAAERACARRVPAPRSWKSWATPWAPRRCGVRPWARAPRARTTRAARAWEMIRRLRW